MAKLPSGADIARLPAPTATPDVRVPALDYGAAGNAARALGGGISEVGKGIGVVAAAGMQAQEYELERRFVDWKLQTEMALEEHRRTMPAGGEGYAETWRESFRNSAREFVGDGDRNIPDALRGKFGVRIAQHEAALSERAQRDQWREQDRATESNLETTLGRTRSAVEADPARLESMHGEGLALIEAAPLPGDKKAVLRKKYREVMDETAATSIVDGVRDAESYRRAKEMLAPHRPERVTTAGVRREIKREADGMAVLSAQSGARFRVSADHAQRFQGLIDDLEQLGMEIKPDQSGGYAKRNIAGTTTPSEHASGRAIDINWNENARNGKAGTLAETIGADKVRELAAKHGLKWGGDWKNPDPMHFEVDRSKQPVAQRAFTAGASVVPIAPGTTEDAYDGPFQSLSLAKRRGLWARAEAQIDKVRKGVEGEIDRQSKLAMAGYLPPEPLLNELDRRVRDLDDPGLVAKHQAMLQQAEWSAHLRKMPAGAIAVHRQRLEAMATDKGATPELVEAIGHAKALEASVVKATNGDPMTWAHTIGLDAPVALEPPKDLEPRMRAQWRPPLAAIRLEPILFDSPALDAQLDRRMDQAVSVGNYYGQPPQAFTSADRDALRDKLRLGGPDAQRIVGSIVESARRKGIDPMTIVKEFSKDAPEVAVLGEMVVSGADRSTIDTATKALAWKQKLGEKFVSTIDKAGATPTLGIYADVLATRPGMVDAVRTTASLVYEYEARIKGLSKFDQAHYDAVVSRIMGASEAGGVSYGGVGRQGTGWSDGKWGSGWFGTPKVLVPPEMRTDGFDGMLGALRAKDFPEMPVDDRGRSHTIGEMRQATWVSVGPGRYVLQTGAGPDGSREIMTRPGGDPYVVDVRPLLDTVRKRAPELFRGYNGADRGIPDPDIEAPKAPAFVPSPEIISP